MYVVATSYWDKVPKGAFFQHVYGGGSMFAFFPLLASKQPLVYRKQSAGFYNYQISKN